MAVSAWKLSGLSPAIFPFSSLSQNIKTRWNSDAETSASFIICDCLIEITVFESSSSGLLSILDIVRTAGWEFSLIHLQFRHSQLSDLSDVQFSNLAISVANVNCASASLP